MNMILIAGPYKGNGDTTLVYEVSGRKDGYRTATWANCRTYHTALRRAKQERSLRPEWRDIPIYRRAGAIGYDDPVKVSE